MGQRWVGTAITIAAIANPILWLTAIVWLKRARQCLVPFVVFNILITPFATILAGCDWAGACF